MDRRTFLRRGGLLAAAAFARPLIALGERSALGLEWEPPIGMGNLLDLGDLSLPHGFRYRIISREGDLMSDGNPMPGMFDGMGSMPGPGGTTILIRNHEIRGASGDAPVVVPSAMRYDPYPGVKGGCTKVLVAPDGTLTSSWAVLGGTTTNCAGGVMPWGSWITCEENAGDGTRRHGYIFEVDAAASGPVPAVPVVRAGRFVHEAVAWHGGALYQTEDSGTAALYRFVPTRRPAVPGELAGMDGTLQALRILDARGASTKTGWPVGTSFAVDWVTIGDPDPEPFVDGHVRNQAHAQGAARFARTEGIWAGGDRIWFDCTTGGVLGLGQVWELNPSAGSLRLIYESTAAQQLANPDNLTIARSGDLLMCENAPTPGAQQRVRGLTPEG